MKRKTTLLIAIATYSAAALADTSIIAQHEQSAGKDSYVGIKLEAPLSDKDKAVGRMFHRDDSESSKSKVQVYGQIDIGYQYQSK